MSETKTVKMSKELFCSWVVEAVNLGCNWYRTSPKKEGEEEAMRHTTTVVDYVNTKMKDLGYDGYITAEKLKAYVDAYPELKEIYDNWSAAKSKATGGVKKVDLELV
jgi:hypothetical protein